MLIGLVVRRARIVFENPIGRYRVQLPWPYQGSWCFFLVYLRCPCQEENWKVPAEVARDSPHGHLSRITFCEIIPKIVFFQNVRILKS